MMTFVARGGDYVAVVTAENKVEAAEMMIGMFRDGGLALVPMEVMQIDPT